MKTLHALEIGTDKMLLLVVGQQIAMCGWWLSWCRTTKLPSLLAVNGDFETNF
jgi:hypothetical protein